MKFVGKKLVVDLSAVRTLYIFKMMLVENPNQKVGIS